MRLASGSELVNFTPWRCSALYRLSVHPVFWHMMIFKRHVEGWLRSWIPIFGNSIFFLPARHLESSLVFSRSFKYMEWSCSLWEIPAHRSCGRVSRPHCWKQLAEPWMLAHEKDFDSDRNLVTISVDLSARGNILEPWNELLSSVCMSVTFLSLYSPVWLYIFFSSWLFFGDRFEEQALEARFLHHFLIWPSRWWNEVGRNVLLKFYDKSWIIIMMG